MSKVDRKQPPRDNQGSALRRGWTTGACAAAAAKSAINALLSGSFIDPVEIALPKGDTPSFALAHEALENGYTEAGIVKDAGDDPDVTHGATIIARVEPGSPGGGITFAAGEGVGTVTRAGLPVPVGEAAVNPVPRRLIEAVISEACANAGVAADIRVTIRVPGGEQIAQRTWNPRLGIIGGISILGTTGVVHPFSCSAWIHSIHRGIDVARAAGLRHVLGATGSTSETAACALHDFPEIARLDMGDFAGGLLKYLRNHPVPRITLAGGFAKFTKLAQGAMDLHSARSVVDLGFLADLAGPELNQDMKARILSANTALEVLEMTRSFDPELARKVAAAAHEQALGMLRGAPVKVEIMIFARNGELLARTDWK